MAIEMKYCMACGTKLTEKYLEGEGNVPFCPSCNDFRFPVFNTAVSMIVTNEDHSKIILIKTIFGIFLIFLFGLRFVIEFVKNDQVDFEAGMALNMGQLLSIPFILAGAVILWWSLRYGKPAPADPPIVESGPKKKDATHYAKPLSD